MFAADAAAAQALTLIAPKNGAMVPLLSEKQKVFMRLSREERAVFFDDAQPKKEKEIKRYRSDPQPVRLAWEGNGPFEVEVTKRGEKEPWFKETVSSNRVDVWNLEIARTYDWEVWAGDESAKGWFRTEDLAPRLIRVPKWRPTRRSKRPAMTRCRAVPPTLAARTSATPSHTAAMSSRATD